MSKHLTETLPLIARVNQEYYDEDEVAVAGDLAVSDELCLLHFFLNDIKLLVFKLFQDRFFGCLLFLQSLLDILSH